ncbi:hypothetical protein SOVF_097850 [Spinacia oleracea]|nr:hypothetical protein SOVF_097850 [Spinacia oleracea]
MSDYERLRQKRIEDNGLPKGEKNHSNEGDNNEMRTRSVNLRFLRWEGEVPL